MRALVYHGPEDVRCDTVPDPTPPTDGCVVKVERTAICGSDLHIYHGHLAAEGGFSIGHEFIGEVAETGSGVHDFRSGDRVLVSGAHGCGSCAPCRRGSVTICERGQSRVFGTNQGLDGGQAEAVAVPGADLVLKRIPEGVSAEQAVLLTDILPTGYFGARGAEIQPGQDVAVVGTGPVGIMSILCAQLFGPARVFALDSVPHRLKQAEELGAIPCDVSGDGRERLLEATGGIGPNAVIEAVGSDGAIQSAVEIVRPGGFVSVVGVNVNPVFPFNMALALMKGITFRIGVCPIPELWPFLVPLVAAGRLSPEVVFTHHMGLSEGGAAYDLFAHRRDGVMKVLLDPAA
ncbi:MAG: alcohol dehydrogenase catalytic domain-containing protein [Myxococcota bacterium]|nr:alcohol dehydrogenase catalytic domain-containing protein [Myxococcota bacterium]